MNAGVNWNLLANLGQTFTTAYDDEAALKKLGGLLGGQQPAAGSLAALGAATPPAPATTGSLATLGTTAAPTPTPGSYNPNGRPPTFAAIGGSPNNLEKQAFDYFLANGHSPVAAAGAVGNLVSESRLNTGAIARGDGRDGSDSVGIAQWNGPRAVAFRDFAARNGLNPSQLETQLAFVNHELNTTEAGPGAALRSAQDPRSAALAFAGYERPSGYSVANPEGAHNAAGRIANAQRIFASYGAGAAGGAGAPTAPAPTRAASADNAADLPAQGAQEAGASFYVPGTSATVPAGAVTPGPGRPAVDGATIAALLRSDKTRGIGQLLWQQQITGKNFGFQVVDGQIYRTNPSTGTAELVAGSPKAEKPAVSTVKPGEILVDQRTGQPIYTAPKEAEPMFNPKTVQGASLNHLVTTKQLTPLQAAQLGAGKVIKDPETGAELFLTPEKIVGVRMPGQASPGEPAANPNAITGPKVEKPTEGQSNAALYATRMREANKVLSQPEMVAATQGLQGAWNNVAASVPGGNNVVTGTYQQAEQAQRDFINAVLRRESGAAIADSEFENARKQYFPRAGDGPEVLAQKARNREVAIAGIEAAAGPALKGVRAAAAPAPTSAPQPAPQAPPQEGSMFINPQTGAKIILRGGQWVPADEGASL